MINLIFAPLTWCWAVICWAKPAIVMFGFTFAGYGVGSYPGALIAAALCLYIFRGPTVGNRESENNQV